MIRCMWMAAIVTIVFALGANAQIRVSPDDALKAVVQKTPPDYPPMAKQMRIAGRVEVEISIDSDGNVTDVKVSSGNALLTQAVVSGPPRANAPRWPPLLKRRRDASILAARLCLPVFPAWSE